MASLLLVEMPFVASSLLVTSKARSTAALAS